jgi:ribosomal protein L37AE/L43A
MSLNKSEKLHCVMCFQSSTVKRRPPHGVPRCDNCNKKCRQPGFNPTAGDGGAQDGWDPNDFSSGNYSGRSK